MRFARLCPLAALLVSQLSTSTAVAQQTTVGYQIGVTQSAGANVGDVQGQLIIPGRGRGR